jgi:hypothetical protein
MVTLHGSIEGRILVNYTADAEALNAEMPEPLTASEDTEGRGIGQVDIMRHRVSVHRRVPEVLRPAVETASHSIAVVNEGSGEEGMYVLRRDIDSEMVRWVGSALPIKEYGRARFRAMGFGGTRGFSIQMDAGDAFVDLKAREAGSVNGSVFGSAGEAEAFQRREERSFEVSDRGFGGSRLSVSGGLQPLEASVARSTVFEGFDGGEFDSAFVGTGRDYEWRPDTEVVPSFEEPTLRTFPKI